MPNPITHTLDNGRKLLLVEVPEDASNIIVDMCNSLLFISDGDKYDYDLPPGNYKLLGTSTTISEEQASELVDRLWDFYRNYTTIDDGTVGNYMRFVVRTAKESLISLLTSLGFDTEKNQIALLEKEK